MMNPVLKTMVIAASVWSVYSCKIADPDFFVPEVKIVQTGEPVTFSSEGGSYSFDVEANCDWSILCPADWITMSAYSGNLNASISITVPESKLSRNTTITVYSNEVEAKSASFNIVQNGVVEISSVSKPIAVETESADGTSATIRASYTGLSISDTDVITAGFVITDQAGTSTEYNASVDRESSFIEATITGLTKDKEYTCTAWVQLNDDNKVSSETMNFTPTSVPKAILSVSTPEASGTRSESGTVATLTSSFTSASVESSDVISAGFILVFDSGTTIPLDAEVDRQANTFSANAENLVTGTSYTCTSWVQLNDYAKVESEGSISFIPTISEPVTIIADFTSNELWHLPDNKDAMEAVEKAVTDDNGYTWKISGGCINSGCLWLACQAKSSFNGYIITPELKDMTVTSINFPNDGPSSSGKARITISVSTDGGASFTVIPECQGVTLGKFELTGQKPGSIYKIENVEVGGNSGYSKTVKLTIEAE